MQHGSQGLMMKITYCLSPFAKLKGLLAKSGLGQDEYYVFAPCRAIHTFGMRFSIDVIFCDKTGYILKHYRQLSPNRLVFVTKAFFTIEFVSTDSPSDEQLQAIVDGCLVSNRDGVNKRRWI